MPEHLSSMPNANILIKEVTNNRGLQLQDLIVSRNPNRMEQVKNQSIAAVLRKDKAPGATS